MITDEFPNQSIDNDYRGLLRAHQMDNMEYPPDPDDVICEACGLPDWWVDNDCEVCGVDVDICEHGMSAWLCMGPNHYPSRDDEMNGRYF